MGQRPPSIAGRTNGIMIRDQVDGREDVAGALVPAGRADGFGVLASSAAVEAAVEEVDVDVGIYGEAELERSEVGTRAQDKN